MKKQRFRSRISVLILLIILIVFAPIFINLFKSDNLSPGLYFLIGILLFILFLLTGIQYIISEGKLQIKLWMIPCGSISISEITFIKRSYNPLSSPAASLKRFNLVLGKSASFQDVLISPVRESEFIKELKEINPAIIVQLPVKKGRWNILNWDI